MMLLLLLCMCPCWSLSSSSSSDNHSLTPSLDPTPPQPLPHPYAHFSPIFAEQCFWQFTLDGFTLLPAQVPELRDEALQHSITQVIEAKKLRSLLERHHRLVHQHSLNCSEVVYEHCSDWGAVANDIEEGVSVIGDDAAVVIDDLYERGLDALQCCVRETNNMLESIGRAPSVALPHVPIRNIHLMDKKILQLALHPQLSKVAGYMLQKSLRLYDTRIHISNFGDADTAWHQDLSDIPLDTETGGFVSFWCPLLSGGQSLTFAKRSHRDVAANYWYTNNPMTEQRAEPVGRDEVPDRYELSSYSDLKVGDCTLHHGWTLYNSQPSDNERHKLAISFSYVYAYSTVLPTAEEVKGYDLKNLGIRRDPYMAMPREEYANLFGKAWLNDFNGGTIIDHPLLPQVYESSDTGENEQPFSL